MTDRVKPWVRELLVLESFTADEAGNVAGCLGSDAITRLRQNKSVTVEIIRKEGVFHRRIYRLRLATSSAKVIQLHFSATETGPPVFEQRPADYQFSNSEFSKMLKAVCEKLGIPPGGGVWVKFVNEGDPDFIGVVTE